MEAPKSKKSKGFDLERLAVSATQKLGSPISLVAHTVLFIVIFSLPIFGLSFDRVMLVLTTIVSLEAIYLSLFIQLTVNRQERKIAEVGHDVEEISEDVEEITKDIDGIQEDVEEIAEDVEEIQEDVEGIEEEVKELGDDVEDISEEMEKEEGEDPQLKKIEEALHRLLADIEAAKKKS